MKIIELTDKQLRCVKAIKEGYDLRYSDLSSYPADDEMMIRLRFAKHYSDAEDVHLKMNGKTPIVTLESDDMEITGELLELIGEYMFIIDKFRLTEDELLNDLIELKDRLYRGYCWGNYDLDPDLYDDDEY